MRRIWRGPVISSLVCPTASSTKSQLDSVLLQKKEVKKKILLPPPFRRKLRFSLFFNKIIPIIISFNLFFIFLFLSSLSLVFNASGRNEPRPNCFPFSLSTPFVTCLQREHIK